MAQPAAPPLEPPLDPPLEQVVEQVVEVRDGGPGGFDGLAAARHWGDGLPLVPPTEARVQAMLDHYGSDADEVVAVVPPRDGEATPRVIAANAVMAGCPDDVLGVLVAAVRALARTEVNLRGVQATTHPVAPLLIVHGDAVGRHGFNPGLGTFGPGNRANATVGRAVRFVLMHVGGGRPGDGDASTQAQPSKYTYCIAEHAAASPWPAFHLSRGIDAASAVTVHCGENPHNFHDMESDEPVRLLTKAASVMSTLGVNNAPISQGEFFVVLCPEHAATIAAHGWTRADTEEFLFETARLPARVLRDAFTTRAWVQWMQEASDDERLPLTESVDNIHVLVAGGPGKHSCVIPSWGMTRSVTMAIEPDPTRAGTDVRIVSPEGRVHVPRVRLAPVPDLAGARIAVLDNRKPNAARLLVGIAERVAARTGAQLTLVTAKATAATPAEPEILQQLESADLVVTGSAD